MFALQSALRGMYDDDWDRRTLETISRINDVIGGMYFDIEPGRRPPMAPSRPRVPTIKESGEYI
jgi:hypothetical protein